MVLTIVPHHGDSGHAVDQIVPLRLAHSRNFVCCASRQESADQEVTEKLLKHAGRTGTEINPHRNDPDLAALPAHFVADGIENPPSPSCQKSKEPAEQRRDRPASGCQSVYNPAKPAGASTTTQSASLGKLDDIWLPPKCPFTADKAASPEMPSTARPIAVDLDRTKS